MIYASMARALSDNSKIDIQKDCPGVLNHADSGLSGPESTRNILNMREAAESRNNMIYRDSEVVDAFPATTPSKEVSNCTV